MTLDPAPRAGGKLSVYPYSPSWKNSSLLAQWLSHDKNPTIDRACSYDPKLPHRTTSTPTKHIAEAHRGGRAARSLAWLSP